MKDNKNVFFEPVNKNSLILQGINTEKNTIERLLNEIAQDKKDLKTKLDNLLIIVTSKNKLEQTISELMNKIRNNINQCSSLLKEMDRTIKMSSQLQESSSILQVRTNVFNLLVEKCTKESLAFSEICDNYSNKKKISIKKQVGIINPNFSSEELDLKTDKLILEGDSDVFKSAQLFDPNWSKAKDRLHQNNQNLKEVLSIEKQLSQLKQLFLDLSFLVFSQGESIDVIQHTIEKSNKNIVKGNKELKEAVKETQHHYCCAIF